MLRTVNWALSLPAFQGLSASDQQLLLDDSFTELLILTALQYKGVASSEGIQLLFQQHLHSVSEQYKMKDIIKCVDSLNLDQIEFTSLKALLLFRPGEFWWEPLDLISSPSICSCMSLMSNNQTLTCQRVQVCLTFIRYL